MSTFKAVVFDFDGVICNSEALHFDACISALKSIGIEFDYETYAEKYLGLPDHAKFPFILDDYDKDMDLDLIRTLTAKKVAFYQSNVCEKKLKSCPGLAEFFKVLQENRLQKAICTSAHRQEVLSTLPRLKDGYTTHDFEHIITIEDVDMGKPAPDGYALSAKRLGLEPSFCLAVEDTPVGIEAAQAAGMKVVGIMTSHPRERLQKADWIASSLACDEIMALVQ